MKQHGVTATELEQYVNALVSSSAQQAAAMDTMAHADMLELTMESLTNGLVLNSNQQAHDVCARSFFSWADHSHSTHKQCVL